MPDWRNANDYRFPDLPDYLWAWEFLRRNPEYRKDWEAALSRFISKTEEFERVDDKQAFLASGGSLVIAGENLSEDPTHPSFSLPVDEADRWGLSRGLVNPATDKPEWLYFSPGFGTVRFIRKGESFQSRGPAFPIVEFDLHLPLKPQLEAINEPLERARKHLAIKSRRIMHYRSLWPHYLRLLDADLDERTPKQIADVLNRESTSGGIDDRKVWDQLKSARRMRSPEGYLTIFLSPSDSSGA
ncbi:MAG: DUF6499 domain-containing protein [Thermoanaerobaculia bacterium]